MSDTAISTKRQSFLDGWAEWEGTRFRYRCCEKGKGTDCIRGTVRELKNVGLIREGYYPPDYPPDWFLFVPEKYGKYDFHNELIKFCEPIPESEAIPGDIVSFQAHGVECHIGIIYPEGKFLHTKPYGKVCYQRLRSYPEIFGYYRIKGIDGT